MDVTATLFTVALTVGSLTPATNGPAPGTSEARIAAGLAAAPTRSRTIAARIARACGG